MDLDGASDKALKEAQEILSGIRRDATTKDVRGNTAYLLGIAREAGFSLADIGTQDAELATLVRCGLVSEAIQYLLIARVNLQTGIDMTEVQVAAAIDLANSAANLSGKSADQSAESAVTLLRNFGRADGFVRDSAGCYQASSDPTVEYSAAEPELVDVGGRTDRSEDELSPEDRRELADRSSAALVAHDPFVRCDDLGGAGRKWILFVKIGDPFPDHAPEDNDTYVEVPDEEIVELRSSIPPPLPTKRLSMHAAGSIQLQA